ncbi:WXG100 family type VII secretion target [Actinoplanes sp. URMC 104]|uniref:WXG100 family type VII secretion target n=1 Tax=Actinoplanes sp. URMC 104 TaxID=3423409 RepID=UPI003F1B95EE
MTLTVEPGALTGYAQQLGRATDDATAIKRYIDAHAKQVTGGELIQIASGSHHQARTSITATMTKLDTILRSSGPELTAAADYYLGTDRQAAATIDRSFPANLRQCATPLEYEFNTIVCKPVSFGDPRHVTDRLTAPPEPENPPNALGFMDYLSPTSWAMKGFDIVLGFDPVSWIQERFSGDWEAVATMAPVLTNAGAALHDLGLNVQSGATTLYPLWQGNAGDAANDYFTDLATGIAALQAPLQTMATEYHALADAVWSSGEAIGGLIKGMIDAAIIAGIAAAGGTATSWTGVGAVAGYGVAAIEVATILNMWGKATELYQFASAAALAFRSKLGSALNDLDTIKLPALPGGASYQHPLAQVGAR